MRGPYLSQDMGRQEWKAMKMRTVGTSGELHAAAALGATDWLCLAAAPTFAIMALLTSILGRSPHEMLCSAAHDSSPLSGMACMYLLMSAFHAGPWLKLIARLRSGAHRSGICPMELTSTG